MNVTLAPDLNDQVALEISSGRYRDLDQLVEQALRQFLADQRSLERSLERSQALRRLGGAVDRAGLYERTFIPNQA